MTTTYGRGVTIGLALLALLSVFDVVFAFVPTPEGEPGPPIEVRIIGALLGLASLVLIVLMLRGGRGVVGWLLVAFRIMSALLGFPAFFVAGVPTWAVILVAVFFALTLVGCALIWPTLRGGRVRTG